eukprot:scaffold9.g3169.t1
MDYDSDAGPSTSGSNGDALDNLPQPLAILQCYDPATGSHTVYYVLGTAHAVKPDIVMVELCIERKPVLSLEKLREPSLSEVLTEIRSGQVTPFQGIYSWLLARVGRNLDVMPGEEFRVALREAHALGAQVVLGDRPLTVTLARLWGALTLWEKLKLSAQLLYTGLCLLDTAEMKEEIEKMKESDVLTEAIREMGKEFPSLLEPLIVERDQYMTFILRRLSARAHRVVAIVGAGHLPGIRDHWTKEIDIDAIMATPVQRRGGGRRAWLRLGLLAASGALASGVLLRYWARR